MKRRNLSLIITGAVAMTVSVILFIVGFYLEGWDIIACLQSPQAIMIYIILGAYVVVVLFMFLHDKISRL